MDQSYRGPIPFYYDFPTAITLNYFPMDFSDDPATPPILPLAFTKAIMEQLQKVHQGPMVAALQKDCRLLREGSLDYMYVHFKPYFTILPTATCTQNLFCCRCQRNQSFR